VERVAVALLIKENFRSDDITFHRWAHALIGNACVSLNQHQRLNTKSFESL